MISNRKNITMSQFAVELEQAMFAKFGRGHRQKAADHMDLPRSVIDKFLAGELKTPRPEMLLFMAGKYPSAEIERVIVYDYEGLLLK